MQGIHKKERPKITIVTPSYNQGAYLEECIDSVLGQNYPNLEYIVMDGGSTDRSPEIIRKYARHLSYWQSRRDGGQYQAVDAGFRMSTGAVMAWINSDDKYHPGALWLVADAFESFPEVEWITGSPTLWDKDGVACGFSSQPPLWSREKYLRGEIKAPYIQQESTFWRRSLWTRAGGGLDCGFRLAADLELWARFFRHAPLHTLHAALGGFRSHPGEGQRSEVGQDRYQGEAEAIVLRERALFDAEPGGRLTPAPAPLQVKDVVARAGSRIGAENFGFFNYSRKSHFPYFSGHDRELYGRDIPPAGCGLRTYQELLAYAFIRQNLPKGARVLIAGDEAPHLPDRLQGDYELWQLSPLPAPPAATARSRMVPGQPGSFSPALPEGYFDLVFSIAPAAWPSAEASCADIERDLARVLKKGGWSLHCFDVADDGQGFRSSPLLPWLHQKHDGRGRPLPFRQVPLDPFVHAVDLRSRGEGVWFSWQLLWRKQEGEAGEVAAKSAGHPPVMDLTASGLRLKIL